MGPSRILCLAISLSAAACATTSGRQQVHPALSGSYDVRLTFGKTIYAGVVDFHEFDSYPVHYDVALQLESPDGAPEGLPVLCREKRIQPVLSGRLDLGCEGLTFEFLRDGALVGEGARATRLLTQTVPTAPTCLRWITRVADPQTGRTVLECAQYRPATRTESWRIGGRVSLTRLEDR